MSLATTFLNKLPPAPVRPLWHTPNNTTLLGLAVLVGITALFHFSLGHTLIASYGLIVWALKAIIIFRKARPPSRWLIVALTITSFVLVLLIYGGWNGQRAGISFLTLLVSLKFLESNSLKDYFLVCLILFFLAASSFLFYSSIESVLLVLVFAVAILAIMLQLSSATPVEPLSALRPAAIISLKAIPIAIIMFFLFPRISGNFGFIPSLDNAETGQLNDSMVAGDFASAAFSNKPAFRVEFENDIPQRNDLYWRVKTMTEERNFTWRLRQPTLADIAQAQQATPRTGVHFSNYDIIHVPSRDNFIPFLDYALDPTIGVQLNDLSVYRLQPKNTAFNYSGRASRQVSISEQDNNLSPDNAPTYLQTSRQPSERLRALITQWQQNANGRDQLIEQVLNYYRDNQFTYSLRPPALGNNPMETFLFDTQTGYCEHYASSFTILMRWLGIPARIVVGFQGGTENKIGNYLEVRYSDAHAWSEVWLNGRWARVDPTITAALGEQRISQGMTALLSLWGGEGWQAWDGSTALSNYIRPTGTQRVWQKVSDTWGNITYQWDKWLINYGFAAQNNLLRNLGISARDRLRALLGLLLTGIIIIVGFYSLQFTPKSVGLSPLEKLYAQFLRKLHPLNLVKEYWETPNEFAERAVLENPKNAKEIDDITQLYVKLTYGKPAPMNHVDTLKSLIHAFNPKT